MTQMQVQTSIDQRPVPEPDELTRFYWEAAAEHRLVLQRCQACSMAQYPPEICCVHCQADELEPAEFSGRGTIYSYSVVERPLHAGFVDVVPYVVVLVELAEQPGLRILANLVNAPRGTALSCGMPVEVVFEHHDDVVLPQFRLSGAN